MKKFHSALFDFCWFPNYDASIEYLANNIADPEPWDFSDATQAKYSILKSYIEHTFRKIKSDTTVQRNYPIGSVDLNRNHSSDVLV